MSGGSRGVLMSVPSLPPPLAPLAPPSSSSSSSVSSVVSGVPPGQSHSSQSHSSQGPLSSPSPNMSMMTTTGQGRWYFSAESLHMTPSRRHNVSSERELGYRQQAANFIQDMGQRLHVPQLCINTAIVYMQRFYMFHSFTRFHRNTIAAAALFLAAKVEEQPRKLEHVIKVAHICIHRDQPPPDIRSEQYMEQAQELVTNENILLQTLGFDVAIDHPHTHVVRCCQLVKASKDLAQTSYFMATNSLHLTTMCLRHTPTIVACVCIHLACKWTNYKIPLSSRGKEWFLYVDPNTSLELLNKLTDEFLTIFDRCPSRLKKKIMSTALATKEEEERRASNDIPANHYIPDYSRRQEAHSSSSNSSKHPSIPMSGKSISNSSSSGTTGTSSSHQQQVSRSSSSASSHHGASRNDKAHHYPGHRSSSSSGGGVPQGEKQVQQQLHEPPPGSATISHEEYKKQKHQQQQQSSSSRLASGQQPPHRHIPSSRPSQQLSSGRPPPPSSSSSSSAGNLSHSQKQQQPPQHHKHNGPPLSQQRSSSQHPSWPHKEHSSSSKQGGPLPHKQQPPLPPPARHHGYPPPASSSSSSSSSSMQQQQQQQHKAMEKKHHPSAPQLPKKSIFDIDDESPPPKPQNSGANGLLNIMLDPTVPLHSIIKESSPPPHQPLKKEKSPQKKQTHKTASLFSPPSSSGSGRNRSLSNCSQSSNEEVSVKLPKVEETPGYEKLRDGYTSIQIPKDPLKTNHHQNNNNNHQYHAPQHPLGEDKGAEEDISGEAGRKKHKKDKKSKKDKKEKKDKKDKDRSRDKSHKHKHKDKDRSKEDEDKDHLSSGYPQQQFAPGNQKSSGIKLKIKPIPVLDNSHHLGAESSSLLPKVDPLKISFKTTSDTSSSSKKRHRTSSSSSSSDLRSTSPSLKIARVIGQDMGLFSSSPEGKMMKKT